MNFLLGVCVWRYHWIRRKGKPAPRETAPIVVSNHVSYIEPIFYFYELFPTIVAAESHDSIPFVGTIIRAMQVISFLQSLKLLFFNAWVVFNLVPMSWILCSQVIYVNRFSPPSRKHAVNEIKVENFYNFNCLIFILIYMTLMIVHIFQCSICWFLCPKIVQFLSRIMCLPLWNGCEICHPFSF